MNQCSSLFRDIAQNKRKVEGASFWLDKLKIEQGDNSIIVLIKIKSVI